MFIVGGIVLAVVFGLIALRPQTWWRATEGWAYRHPDANEPSDLAYGLQSVSALVVAGACLVGGFVLQHNESAGKQRAEDCATVKEIVGKRGTDQLGAIRTELRARGFTPSDAFDDTGVLGVDRDGKDIATVLWTSEYDPPQVTCD